MESIKKILRSNTVNSIGKSLVTVNSNTVIGNDLVKRICELIKTENIKPEGIALHLAELLQDKKSLPYYFLLAKEHNPGELFLAAYQAKEKAEFGQIRTTRAIYFIGILRRKGFKTKFR